MVGYASCVAFRLVLHDVSHRAPSPISTHVNRLYRMAQPCYLLTQFAHFPLQGLSDVGAPLRHVIFTQVHVLLAVVGLQALNLLSVFLAVDGKNLFPTPYPSAKRLSATLLHLTSVSGRYTSARIIYRPLPLPLDA